MFELIKKYTEIAGPVGHEEQVAEQVVKDWEPLCERLWTSNIGNVFAKIGGQGKKLLITAHLDEINMLVKSITDDGFLWLTHGTGGSETTRKPNHTYIGQPALIKGKDGYVSGHIVAASGHVMTVKQRAKQTFDWEDFFVDLGVSSREEVLALGIRPGRPVIFDVQTKKLGKHIVGKAMDDRLGLVIMTKLAEELKGKDLNYEVYFAATVQEEIGMVGANSLTKEVDFDMAIALEIGLTGDQPTVDSYYMPTGLCKGPIIAHKDATVQYSEKVAAKLEAAADQLGLPVQHAVFQGYGSDGAELIRAGVPAALFTFPTRYTHSPYEMVNEQDVVAMVEILKQLCING